MTPKTAERLVADVCVACGKRWEVKHGGGSSQNATRELRMIGAEQDAHQAETGHFEYHSEYRSIAEIERSHQSELF